MVAGFGIVAIAIALFVIVTVLMGVRQVPQGYNYTVERFGRYNKTLTPGLGLIIPYVDRIGRKLSVMEQVVDVPSQEIITKDNASVKVDGVAFYSVLDPRRASYEVSNLEQALLNLVMTNIRTVMGSMDLDQLLSHRDEINVRLLNVIDAASQPWGIKVTSVEIKDVALPDSMKRAMAKQAEAERERRAKIVNAEGEFQAAEKMVQAASMIAKEPIALQLRYLQTMREMASEHNTTTFLPLPIDLFSAFLKK